MCYGVGYCTMPTPLHHANWLKGSVWWTPLPGNLQQCLNFGHFQLKLCVFSCQPVTSYNKEHYGTVTPQHPSPCHKWWNNRQHTNGLRLNFSIVKSAIRFLLQLCYYTFHQCPALPTKQPKITQHLTILLLQAASQLFASQLYSSAEQLELMQHRC